MKDQSSTKGNDALNNSNSLNDETNRPLERRIFKVNYGFLCFFAMIAGMGIFQLGYVLTANNQVSPILDIQFNLTDKSDKNFYHTMIGSSAVLGATIGSFSAGKIIQIGRRRSIIIFNFIGAVAVFGTLILNFYTICAGRLVLGFCGGLFSVALSRMIDETIPQNLLGTFGVVTNLSMNAGNMFSILMGAGLPDQEDTKASEDSNFWRIIFGFPWVFQIIQVSAFLFIVRYESIKFLIDHKRDNQALKAIQQVYHSSENPQEILDYIRRTGQKPSSNKISMCKALTGQNFWRATWFCILFGILLQLTGINAIIWYSNNILQKIQDDSGHGISPRLGTILIGVTNFIGSIISIFVVRRFGRKTLMVSGNLVMALLLFLVGLFSFLKFNNVMLIMILLFLLIFQQSDGPIFYMYASEITQDTGLGFAFLSLKGSGLIISLTTEYLMDSVLQPSGAFLLFACITLAGAIFFIFAMKETKHLTDKEKKDLYKTRFKELEDIQFEEDIIESDLNINRQQ
ncbi:sugar transporter family protein [Stylonychia lemnae]|uniref:Hexose transporter 1 n=1 Tax=Stylonychia lemnae TaxID=5949 RepID=A0A077ZS23_STYLE|nr:sugar transporter family protein [Stylonychia lemnae]|eukprot:CDW72682.1 sugar transporter family protein [Stylonychia lemnae]